MECHIGVLRFVVDSCTQQESQSPARNLDSWCAYVCMYVHRSQESEIRDNGIARACLKLGSKEVATINTAHTDTCVTCACVFACFLGSFRLKAAPVKIT